MSVELNLTKRFCGRRPEPEQPLKEPANGKRSHRLLAGLAAIGIMLGGSAQAQTTITGAYPDGTRQFQLTNSFSFTAASPAGVSNITLLLTCKNLSTMQTSIRPMGLSALTITGSDTSKLVSAPLFSNSVYTAVISVTDSNNVTATQTTTFDTIAPDAYVIEMEDWDYGTGQFFNSPQTNAYANMVSNEGVDVYANGGGGAAYRPHGTNTPSAWSTEGCGDIPRAPYIGTGFTDYDVGYTDQNEWANYTRNYPKGDWYVYLRVSHPDGGDFADGGALTLASGTATFSTTDKPRFGIVSTGDWQKYKLNPLVDASGKPVVFTSDGTASKLLYNIDSGNNNLNYFMLIPAVTNVAVADVVFTNIYPNGTNIYQPAANFSLTASSSATVNPSDITVLVGSTNLWGATSSSTLTVGNGLTLTSPGMSPTVSFPLASNTVYSVLVQVFDSAGGLAVTNISFDTITPSFSFEMEDFNYGGGSYIDNPDVDAYFLLDGVEGIDDFKSTETEGSSYPRLGWGDQNSGDIPRIPWITSGLPDYVTDGTGGKWANFTRTVPKGTYNIYIRASGNGSTDSASFSTVDSDRTQPNQATSKLGIFSVPATGSWDKYTFVPCKDLSGNLARITIKSAGGELKTFRVTIDNGNCNANFIIFTPVDPSVVPPPTVDGFQPDGTAMCQLTNQLGFRVHSDVGVASGNVKLSLDGVNLTDSTFVGTPNLWTVTHPVSANALHTAVITVTDANGSCTNTYSFNTFDTNSYEFEAEDFDYTDPNDHTRTGLFFDKAIPDVDTNYNQYTSLPATQGIDAYSMPGNFDGTHVTYRGLGDGFDKPVNGGLNTEGCGDSLKPAAHTANNYDMGSTTGGNWGNYTRHYPAGTYNIYLRSASPNVSTAKAGSVSLVTGGWGTTNEATTVLGSFDPVSNTGGWQVYGWFACKDASGNLVEVTMNGSTNTLRCYSGGGNNADYYLLVPKFEGAPSASGLYPDGLSQFEGTNKLTFDANSTAGIDSNSIVVNLNGVAATGLVITGSSTSWHVSYSGLQSNVFYTAIISFQTLVGTPFTTTVSFDTFASNNYQWEAEDWDYTQDGVSGKFFDNPQVDKYYGLHGAEGIDVAQTINNANVPYVYSTFDANNWAPGTDINGSDKTRAQFDATHLDYRVNWFGYGSWCNYTRHYPKGNYNIVGRFTEGGATPVNITLSRITGGWGTTIQSSTRLGQFVIPSLGWDTWQSVYLTDANNKNVVVAFDDSQQTLRVSGELLSFANVDTINAGYFMLVPAAGSEVTPTSPLLTATVDKGIVTVSFPTESGFSYQVLYKDNLTDATWTALGSSVSGTGSVGSVSGAASETSRFYRVQVQ